MYHLGAMMKYLVVKFLVDDHTSAADFAEELTQCLLEGKPTDAFVYNPKFAITNVDLTDVEEGIPDPYVE